MSIESTLAQIERLIDKLKEKPWTVFLALAIAHSAWGWLRYAQTADKVDKIYDEWRASDKVKDDRLQEKDKEVINAQNQTIQMQNILIMRSTPNNQRDTNK